MHVCMHMCIYTYMYRCICACVCTLYVYTYIQVSLSSLRDDDDDQMTIRCFFAQHLRSQIQNSSRLSQPRRTADTAGTAAGTRCRRKRCTLRGRKGCRGTTFNNLMSWLQVANSPSASKHVDATEQQRPKQPRPSQPSTLSQSICFCLFFSQTHEECKYLSSVFHILQQEKIIICSTDDIIILL